jgi:hypothetical protein
MNYTASGVSTAGFSGAVGGLAATGISSLWMIVAGVALMTAGICLARMIPKDEF